MADQEVLDYRCDVCGFLNKWTRAEILQRGKKKIFKGTAIHQEDLYSLSCKNPAVPACTQRQVVAVEREQD
jgi:hypothetical protein